jgi:hypothetical protein
MAASTLAGSVIPSSAPKMACDSKSWASVGIASLTGDLGRDEAAELGPDAVDADLLGLEARFRPKAMILGKARERNMAREREERDMRYPFSVGR